MSTLFAFPDATSIALHTCVFLTMQPQGEYYSTRIISDEFGFSVHHVAKIVQKLARAGLLDTSRGGQGGIRLKRTPSEISVYDVYSAIEGAYDGASCGVCMLRVDGCNGHDCLLGKWMKKTSDETISLLKNTSLPTLLASVERFKRRKMRFLNTEEKITGTVVSVEKEHLPDSNTEVG